MGWKMGRGPGMGLYYCVPISKKGDIHSPKKNGEYLWSERRAAIR